MQVVLFPSLSEVRENMNKNLTLAICSLFLATSSIAAESIQGLVKGGDAPIANSAVTLWAATAGAPRQLAGC